jgi:hypothetical protein
MQALARREYGRRALSAIAWLHHSLHFVRWRFRFAILGYFGFGTNGFGVTFRADVWHHSRRN